MILFIDFTKKESKQKLFDHLKSLSNVYRLEIKRDKDNRSTPGGKRVNCLKILPGVLTKTNNMQDIDLCILLLIIIYNNI